MQEPRMVSPDNVTYIKPKKKKPLNQVSSAIQKKGDVYKGKETPYRPLKTKNVSKKFPMTGESPPFQQMDASTPDSLSLIHI